MTNYTNGVAISQAIGSALNVAPEIISHGLWLFAQFTSNLENRDPSNLEAIACLIIEENKHSPTNLLNISTVINCLSLESVKQLLPHSNSDETIEENDISIALTTISDFISKNSYKSLPKSTIEVTLEYVSLLFGGSSWSKESFGQNIVAVAVGVINDLYRFKDCIKYHPNHWAIAAIHYALCSYISEEDKGSENEIVKYWKRWITSGIRWWINFEVSQQEQISKFDPFSILLDLMNNVYIHIEKTSSLYQLLLNDKLKPYVKPLTPKFHPQNISFDECILESDQTSCPSFSIDISQGYPMLHQVIRSKSLLEVRYLVEYKKHNLLEQQYDDSTCLFVAAEKGDTQIVQYICEQAKQQNILEELINKPKHSGATPLHVASYLGHYDIVKILIENKAEINTQVLSNHNTPIYDAINQRNLEIVELLLSNNADTNIECINGGYCMHAAAYSNSPKIISKLFTDNSKNQLSERKAPHGETPLHIACQVGNNEAVKELLNLNASVSNPDFRYGAFAHESFRGLTPWHFALFKKNGNLLQILLSTGALPDLTVLQLGDLYKTYQNLIRPSNNEPSNEIENQKPLPKRPKVA